MSAAPALALRAELTRKALHLGTAVLPVAWAADLVSAATVRLALTVATATALVVEAARRWHPGSARRFAAWTSGLLRPHEARALTGATWLALAMTAVAWTAPERAAIAALWAAAVGDASAAIVGRTLAARRRDGTAAKSLAGSLAAAASTALGVRALVQAPWAVAAALGAVAALAERPTAPLDDNLRVTLAVALAATVFGLR